ncbi:hypothetical protein SZN_31154 [Streptomyces zinciresistens K42]|uniref:Uncharacterized protein n=1 Tax=Streptomyces zinciresistens K42 TaxID=700597 RepID=G2GL35_9ACTN|nr:hypothetical protein [Streptomyces zinciresistens]EGX55778.1 hypothetical protein SZN_31154 [Streptomyces zinciresistens K42]
MDPALIPPAVLAAALVVRVAVAELRAPGAARAATAFLRDPAAAGAACAVVAAAAVMGRTWPALAWGVLAGVLTGHLTHRSRDREDTG